MRSVQLHPPARSSCAFARETLRPGCDAWFDSRWDLASSIRFLISSSDRQLRARRSICPDESPLIEWSVALVMGPGEYFPEIAPSRARYTLNGDR
jgi:hypothetical protein